MNNEEEKSESICILVSTNGTETMPRCSKVAEEALPLAPNNDKILGPQPIFENCEEDCIAEESRPNIPNLTPAQPVGTLAKRNKILLKSAKSTLNCNWLSQATSSVISNNNTQQNEPSLPLKPIFGPDFKLPSPLPFDSIISQKPMQMIKTPTRSPYKSPSKSLSKQLEISSPQPFDGMGKQNGTIKLESIIESEATMEFEDPTEGIPIKTAIQTQLINQFKDAKERPVCEEISSLIKQQFIC